MLAERQIKRVLTPVTSPRAKRSLIGARDEVAGGWARARAAARPQRMTPSFVIIGAQKAGTTYLYQELVRHPSVRPALTKEIHYFDDRYERWRRSYHGFFPVASGDPRQITGEASPGYIFHPWAVPRLAADLPDAKLLVLLRDPVHRAFSQYQHEVRLGFEDAPTFADALAREEGRLDGELERMLVEPDYVSFAWRHFSYRRRGHYLEQLLRVEDHVARDQVLVLRSEALYLDPATTIGRVVAFLGLAPWTPSTPGRNDMASGGAASLDPGLERDLRAYFAPLNAGLAAHLGDDVEWAA